MEGVKTVFVLVGSGSGGLENYLLRLFEYRTSLEADIIFTSNDKGILYNRFEEKANNIENFDLSSPFNIKAHLKFLRYLATKSYVNLVDFRGTAAGTSILLSWLSCVPNRIVFFELLEGDIRLIWPID